MTRSLLPREHGAYAQLGAPLAAALVAHPPTAAGLSIAVAACFAFVANEPLLVVLGHRGSRRRDVDRRRAWRWLAVSVTAAVGSGGVGLTLASHAIPIAGVVAAVSVALVGLAWRRAQRTLLGEIVAAIALPGAAAVVAVADGTTASDASIAWLGWSVGYASTVIAVHRVIDRSDPRDRWVPPAALVTTAAAMASCAAVVPRLAIGLPLVLTATALTVAAPPAKRLRAIGFALVGASLASCAIEVALA